MEVIMDKLKLKTAHLSVILFLNLFLFFSCEKDYSPLSPTGLNESFSIDVKPVNIQSFDSYSGDSKVKLYWTTGKPIIDPSSTPPPHVGKVEIYISESGADENFKRILTRNRDGDDSTLVENLVNGKVYFFRLVTYTEKDDLIGVSKPLMTFSGLARQPFASLPAEQAENPLNVSNLSWSPDGQQLAVIKKDLENRPNIFVLNANTLNMEQITNYTSDIYRLLSVAWSPDGNSLAYDYTASHTFYQIDYRIWLVSLNNLQTRNITSGRVDAQPTWVSNDRIVFSKGTHGPPNIAELYLVEILNGNNEVAITNDQIISKYTPRAHPGMDLIVYSGERVNPNGHFLYLISLSSSLHEALTENAYWQDIHPSWAPNGQKVYFTSDRSGHFEVWSVDIINREIEQITRGLERGVQKFYGRVSPQGDRIAIIELNSNNEYKLKILPINQPQI